MEYQQDTVLTEIITSVNDCDSIITTTNIHVEPTFFTAIEATILDGETYTIGNSTYEVSGVYYNIFTAQNGCDSIVELTLTVDQVDALSDFNDPKIIDLQTFPNPFSNEVTISFLARQEALIAV